MGDLLMKKCCAETEGQTTNTCEHHPQSYTCPANGKSHRKAGQNAPEQADKNDDQANFDPVETK